MRHQRELVTLFRIIRVYFNQNDLEERSSQVAVMKDIYARAMELSSG